MERAIALDVIPLKNTGAWFRTVVAVVTDFDVYWAYY